MKKTNLEKGITLIALIITIVVLLILAVVTINSIQGDGIIRYAQNAADDYTTKANAEQESIDTLLGKIEGTLGISLLDAQSNAMLDKKTNSTTYDIYGNKIVIPAGFKILVDSTTGYTTENISVTKGVVIQDEAGNEFVWVPVGTIYTNTTKTESKTITLGRYAYENFIKNESGEYVPSQIAENYAIRTKISSCAEETESNRVATPEWEQYGTMFNVIAKSIKDFCLNSLANGGYYIGRFEAGDLETTIANTARTSSTGDGNTLVCKNNQKVYNYVTQPQASSLSQNMYKDAKTFTSDLINSYAWDTAIIFIQTFGNCEDYYEQKFSTGFANTGTSNDKFCNIYDMSGNTQEFSTESMYFEGSLICYRGTSAVSNNYCGPDGTLCRDNNYGAVEYASFRTVLYF